MVPLGGTLLFCGVLGDTEGTRPVGSGEETSTSKNCDCLPAQNCTLVRCVWVERIQLGDGVKGWGGGGGKIVGRWGTKEWLLVKVGQQLKQL